MCKYGIITQMASHKRKHLQFTISTIKYKKESIKMIQAKTKDFKLRNWSSKNSKKSNNVHKCNHTEHKIKFHLKNQVLSKDRERLMARVK